MPHTPDTHITITPKHIYINGEPTSVTENTVELRTSNPVEIQTVTLTISPTSVTILNENNTAIRLFTKPETSTHEWLHTARDEADDPYSTYIHPNDIDDMIGTLKQYKATQAKHTQH